MIDYEVRNKLNMHKTPPPLLTIVDDDGHLDYHDYLLPFSNEMKAPITSAVTPLRIGGLSKTGRYMVLSEIKECMENGAEIICHTYTHKPALDDIKRTHVVNGTLSNSTTFISNGSAVTPEDDATYHDTTTGKYYTYSSANTYDEIADITIYDQSKLIDVYKDVSYYYAASSGEPMYQTKEEYYTDKLAHYYTVAKNYLLQNGFVDGDVIAYNNNTGLEPIAQNAAKRVFRYGVGFDTSLTNYYGRIDRYHFNRYGIESSPFGYYDPTILKNMISALVANKTGWMIWTMHTTGDEWHGRTVDGHTGIGKNEVMNRLRVVINYAHYIGLPIVTIKKGASVYVDGQF